jgi:hypothetical protein
MLEDLERYENLGTPGYFWELLKKLQEADARWTVENVREYFFNRILDGQTVFDGCIPFACEIGLIKVEGERVVLNGAFGEFLMSERYMRGKLLEWAFTKLGEDELFAQIFSPANISYDVVYNMIQIDSGAFGFRFSNLRRLLMSFEFVDRHPDRQIGKLIVNPKYRALFDRFVLPEVRRRKLGLESLEEMLAQRQLRGAEGEEFVLAFEKRRMASHPRVESIQKISDYDVAAGYDIASFSEMDSAEHDRFIEVKSCSVSNRFYWSRNEIDQARIRRSQYYLYLVDPSQLQKNGYEPVMIQNPYENVFLDESWSKEPQTWLFSKK